jgi:hypothetical protein
VISLAGLARSLSKASPYRNFSAELAAEHDARLGSRRLKMQSNDAIEVVAPLGGGFRELTLFPDAAAVLAGTAGVLAKPGGIFHAARRHLSSLESNVAMLVRTLGLDQVQQRESGGAVESKSEVGVGTAVRLMLRVVDRFNSIATF